MSSGAYFTSFFEISLCLEPCENKTLGGDGEIFPKLTDNGYTTFFHEYIHYLQNISSLGGVYEMWNTFSNLYKTIDDIQKSNAYNIVIPCGFQNDDRFDHYYGNMGDMKDNPISDFEIVKVSIDYTRPSQNVNIGGNIFYEDVKVYYKDIEDTEYYDENFHLGAIQISESMAYIMQRCCFPIVDVGELGYPYNVVEKLANYLCPKLSEKDDLLIYLVALCDFSLQFHNPGKIMFKVLLDIEQKNFCPQSPEEIYFYKSDCSICSSCEDVYTHLSYTDNYIEFANALKNVLIANMSDVAIYCRYFNEVFDYVTKLRKDRPFFMLDIARSKDVRKEGILFDIIDQIGTPMINFTDDADVVESYDIYMPLGFDYDNDDGQIQFYLQSQQRLYRTLCCGETSCGLINVCKECCKNVFDEDICNNEPWKQAQKSEHCPFGYIWDRYLRNIKTVY